MKPVGAVLGALVVVALCPYAWADDEAAVAGESLEQTVRARQTQIEQKMTLARNRIQHKNFVAARSALSDAAARVRGLQSDLPSQRISVRLTAIERNVKAGKWAEARRAVELAFRELDSQARYIDATKIWQHLDDARGFVADRRGRLALQEVRTAKRFAYVDEVTSPLRRTLVYLSDAKRELLKLPIFFRGKRAAASRQLDAADAELSSAYRQIDRLLAGQYATGR